MKYIYACTHNNRWGNMIAKIYSKMGPLYILIEEEEIEPNEIDRIIGEWKYADLIEIFDKDELVYTYTPSDL